MNILQQIAALLGGKLTKVHEKTVANKEAIEAEVRRAQASETLLDTNIKNETKRAQEEETRIELKAVDLVNAEEARATKAESDLSTKIDTDVKAEADRAKGAEQAIIGNLNAETARAKAAEKANSDAIISLDEMKVDKIEGKQLSTEDYTTAEKTKLGHLGTYVSDVKLSKSDVDRNLVITVSTEDPVTGNSRRGSNNLPLVSDAHNGLMSPSQKLVLDNLLSGDSALSILGTPSSTWQLNLGSGPKLKNSGGVFELRNAADDAYADLTVNALTIKGNVTQEGGSFITQAETVSAKDNTILLNSGETGAGVTKGEAGVEIDRGTLPKYKFIFDESDDRFKVGSEGDLWSVMLRDNESDLTNKGILTWDATTKRAKTAFNIDDLADTYLPLAGGNMSGTIHIAPISTDGEIYNGIQPLPGTWRDNALLTYDAETIEVGSADASLNLWGKEITITTRHNNISLVTSSSGHLYHKISRNNYLIYDENNLDISKFALAANYIPLAGNSKDTPITGHLYAQDVFDWGIYGMKIEGADGLPRTAHIQFNANQTGAMGSEPAKSNAYTEMGSIGEVWGPNTVSQLRVGYEDNLPVLKYRNNPGDGTSIKEYNIYHEGNLDVNSMVSGFLPLSAGMDKPLTGVLYASGFGGAGRRGINITSGTITSSDSGVEFISREGVMGMGMVQDEGASIWVGTSQDDTHICATIDNSDRWTFPNGIYIQGSKGATLEDLSGYLPLSGGTMTSALKFTPMGSIAFLNTDNSIRALLGYGNLPTGKLGLILKATLENNIIAFNTPGDLFHQKGSSEYKIWTEGNDGAGSGLDADLLDGKQGSEYALTSSLSSYLPLSAGGSNKLTGALWAPVGTPGGAGNFNVNVVAGSSTVSSASIEVNAKGTSIGFGAHEDGNSYFWVGGNGTQEKGHFATINKTSKGMNFIYRPMYNGSNLATVSEIPTSMAWGLITGKPSFATVATSGSYNDLSNKPSIPSIPSSLPANGGTSTYSTYLRVNDLRASAIVPTYGEQEIIGWFNNLGTPDGNWWSGIHVKGWTTTYSAWQLAGPSHDSAPASDALWFRSGKDSSWNGWKRVAFANEIPTTLPASDVYSWAKAASKPSYGWTEITGKPASMPASDVYAWAKASSKPSYAWSEITGKPTIPSLSGYATQSWVQSQGYLTSHQSLANYVTLNTAQTISGAKTFTSFVICSAGSGTSSDIRLKKYINRMFDAEELLSNLSGYRYVMKETDMHYAGLIAQEVQEVLPEAVREDENGFLTVDTYPIIAALVEANKAKDNRIKALEDRITALEKKMNMILNKLG